jgi:hypothetical protein
MAHVHGLFPDSLTTTPFGAPKPGILSHRDKNKAGDAAKVLCGTILNTGETDL